MSEDGPFEHPAGRSFVISDMLIVGSQMAHNSFSGTW